jgi:hypothetical protein
MEKHQLLSPSRQCSSTPVGFGQGLLSKDNVTTLQHPPYYPELAAGNFYLFPPMKSSLNWRRFCDTTDITKNATKELKRLSSNGFLECFQHIFSRWQKCVAAQVDCFEEYVA